MSDHAIQLDGSETEITSITSIAQKSTMTGAMYLNKLLAEKFGWKNIVSVDGALLGTPPAHLPSCRGQSMVPNWVGCDASSFQLMCSELAKQPVAERLAIVCRAISGM